MGDFPDLNKFRARLREVKDLRRFPKLDKSMVYEMEKVFSVDIPRLLTKASTSSHKHKHQHDKPAAAAHHHHPGYGGRR